MAIVTLQQIQQFLAQVAYKPGYQFSASADKQCLILRLDVVTKDSDAPRLDVRLGMTSAIPFWEIDHEKGREVIVERLWRLILDFERHEAAEWFRVNGVRSNDPHSTDRLRVE